jgi:hypothetical protein
VEICRDQYIETMTFGRVDRPLLFELFGPLVGLEDQWRQQGASEAEINLTAFGFDYVRWEPARCYTGLMGGAQEVVLEDNEEFQIRRDRLGRRCKLCKGSATIALPLDYPVTDMDSWLKIKPRYEFASERLEANRDAPHDPEAMVVAFMPGGFDEPRQLMGEEGLCIALYEDRELVHDMLDTIGAMVERTLETVSRKVRIDQLSIHEDMAGKSGPLMGPTHITEFLKPYYRRVWDMLASRGATIFAQDSDGDMNAVIPAFLDAGVNHMYPFEPAAGMDIVETRKIYGKALSMRGGIDKHVLRQDQAAIRRELEYKLQPMMREGGVAFGLDHRIPNGTPIENYRYYVRTAREILGLDPNPAPGWGRTAF